MLPPFVIIGAASRASATEIGGIHERGAGGIEQELHHRPHVTGLAALLLWELLVTVTDVNTSPDLRHSRVHVSVLGDEEAHARSERGGGGAEGDDGG